MPIGEEESIPLLVAESCLPSRLFEGLLWGNFMVLAGKFSTLGFDWAISRKQTLRMLSPAAASGQLRTLSDEAILGYQV
jgi:hypothetical protein